MSRETSFLRRRRRGRLGPAGRDGGRSGRCYVDIETDILGILTVLFCIV